ncbi:hypothetical protein [Lentzea californiensis]|uniref:hypothetical protein n=1 Tax=Lentzea californiensis TaxID=438851 RepID=UPI002165CDCD|nr:hypothetical protein [Lentzea californiensis]
MFLLTSTACTSDEPAPPSVTRTVAPPLNQTGPNTPDQRPVTAIQIDHRTGKTTVNGSTSLTQGTVVDLTVLSDLDDQVTIEVLQLSTTLTGGSARLQFTATTPGTFPIRLRDNKIELATLKVT